MIPVERSGRAAAESQRRAMRRLAALGLIELSWKVESVETRAKAHTDLLRWDPEAGVYREVRGEDTLVARSMERRAVRLTELGGELVDQLRPTLETGRRIRWRSIDKMPSNRDLR